MASSEFEMPRWIPVSLGVVIVLLTIYYRFLSKKRPQPSIEKQPRSNDDDEEDIPEDDDLVAKFEAAKAFFANHSDEVDTEVQLEVYGLFKCAKDGRCTDVSKPSRLDMRGYAKWEAHQKASEGQGRTCTLAMENYIKVVSAQWPAFGSGAPDTAPQGEPKKKPQGFGRAVSTMATPEPAEGVEHDLLWAAGEGNLQEVQALLDAKADVAQRFPETDNIIALHMAASKGRDDMVLKLLGWYPEGVNALDEDDSTPLHYALETRQIKCAQVLLSHGADPTLRESMEDRTPLEMVKLTEQEMALLTPLMP